MTRKGVLFGSPGVNSATDPNGTLDTRVRGVPAGMVEKVIPYPIYAFVVGSI